MALQINNYTGFETQGAEESFALAGTPSYPTTDPKSGAAHLSLDSGDRYTLRWVEDDRTDQGNDYIITFGLKVGDKTPGSNNGFFRVQEDGAGVAFELIATTAGNILVEDANGSTIRTLTDPLSTTTYQLWQIYFQHSASGTIEIFIDGVSQGEDTAQDLTDGLALSGNAGIRFSGPNGITSPWLVDDVLIQSGAASAADRYSDVEVFKYQSTKASTTPDDGGTTLNAGTWDKAGETPLAATATNPEYTSAGAGAVDSNAADGSPEGPKNDARIDGDSNIKAIKGISNMKRSGGGGTDHFILLGNDVDGTTRSVDLAPTTAFVNYFFLSELGTIVPLSTEYCRIGFETSGDQDFECQEMWAMLLHVPAAVGPPPIINLVMAPYIPT